MGRPLGRIKRREDYLAVAAARTKWVAPGFIDGHMHVESTLVTVPEFARAALPHGTVAAIFDPHEIANLAADPAYRPELERLRSLGYMTEPNSAAQTDGEQSSALARANRTACTIGAKRS